MLEQKLSNDPSENFGLMHFENSNWLSEYFLSSYIIYLFTGKPISGSGAGLRPIGQDPNFVADLRESFNIAVPVLSDEVQWVEIISERALIISIPVRPTL